MQDYIAERGVVEDVVEKFLKNYGKGATYRSWLKSYFEIIEKNPNNYFAVGRNYDKDILTFAENVQHWGRGTRVGAFSCVRNFFMFNDVELKPNTKYKLRKYQKGKRKTFVEKVPNRDELKLILSWGSVCAKAMFLLMAHAGLRPAECLGLKIQHIYLKETPVRIFVRAETTRMKENRITFCSLEAKHWILQWLKIRDKYIKSKKNKAVPSDDRLFPMTYKNMDKIWHKCLEKSGFDSYEVSPAGKTRHLITPQKLRKYFKTQMSDAGINFEKTEAMMGHEEGMAPTYRKFSDNHLKKEYLKGEPNLLVFEAPVNQAEIEDLKDKFEILQRKLEAHELFWNKIQTHAVKLVKKDK